MVNELATPLALSLAVALVLSGCTGDSDTAPSPSPATSSPAVSPSPSPSETVGPSPSPTASPTATPSPTPTSEPPSPTPSPTPTAAVGIDPPAEAPSEFGEFVIPAPDLLTEEYAAWVLAEFTRAEDDLTRLAIDAPDDSDGVPEPIRQALASMYAGDSLGLESEVIAETVSASDNDEIFVADPAPTQLSNIELLDATQECLLLQYVEDLRGVTKDPPAPTSVIALFVPKPEIDGSPINRTPWQMTNRTIPEDVDGRSC